MKSMQFNSSFITLSNWPSLSRKNAGFLFVIILRSISLLIVRWGGLTWSARPSERPRASYFPHKRRSFLRFLLSSLWCQKILMKCASNRTEMFEDKHKCTSETLQEWVFVALQYIVISKKLLICDYDTAKLRNLVRELGKKH